MKPSALSPSDQSPAKPAEERPEADFTSAGLPPPGQLDSGKPAEPAKPAKPSLGARHTAARP